eukprot:TRINITY_DN13315_c0_g2_i1.p2 TRINITY_DN13315_c0_g2~~TRINITY_DN13315_c0_g2_i1.p2  ORF type:complete len:165 (+),score=3.43 TRINITY_DN13315_c0_g2_i1:958-1452(+)
MASTWESWPLLQMDVLWRHRRSASRRQDRDQGGALVLHLYRSRQEVRSDAESMKCLVATVVITESVMLMPHRVEGVFVIKVPPQDIGLGPHAPSVKGSTTARCAMYLVLLLFLAEALDIAGTVAAHANTVMVVRTAPVPALAPTSAPGVLHPRAPVMVPATQTV